MEPIEMIVAALALGAAAGLKPTTEQTIKDSYAALKRLIQKKYSKVSLEQIEEHPESQARQAVIQEDLEKAGAINDADLLQEAQKLLAIINDREPNIADVIGVNLEEICATSLNIQDVVSSGTGVSVNTSNFSGAIKIKSVQAGETGNAHPKIQRQ